MDILAIDPGTARVGFAEYSNGKWSCFIEAPEDAVDRVRRQADAYDIVAIEMPKPFRRTPSAVLDTCVVVGRLQEAAGDVVFVPRSTVAAHLGAKGDTEVRRALIDRFPATGGGKTPQIGTKAEPGPLYGVSKDMWAALAVGVWAQDTQGDTQ